MYMHFVSFRKLSRKELPNSASSCLADVNEEDMRREKISSAAEGKA